MAQNKLESRHGLLAFVQQYTVSATFADVGVRGASLCVEAEELEYLELDPQSCILFRDPAPSQGILLSEAPP